MTKEARKAQRLKILEQIRAMLSKTVDKGCTEAEAASTAEMVQQLVEKYNITPEELKIDIESGDAKVNQHVYENRNPYGVPQQSFTWDILRVLGRIFSCRTIRIGKTYNSTAKISIVGLREDADAMNELYWWLFQNMYDAEVASYRARKGTSREGLSRWTHYMSFCTGYAEVLCKLLRQGIVEKQALGSGYALVVYKDELVKAFVDTMNTKNVGAKGGEISTSAYLEGKRVGHHAKLNPNKPLEEKS